jgi:outer membrane lipoprotein-sorting protein
MVLVGLLSALSLSSACAPVTISPATPTPSAAKVLADIRRPPAVQTLEAWGKNRLFEGNEKWSAEMAMILKRPNKIRLEGFSPFGTSLYSLTVDHGEVTFFVPSERKAYKGTASPATMAHFFALPLEPADVLDVLIGKVPLCGDRALDIHADGTHWVLEVPCEQEGWLQQIRVRPDDLQMDGFSYYGLQGTELLKVEWKAFQSYRDTKVPTEIVMAMPEKQQRLQLVLYEFELNVGLSDDRFVTQLPPNTEVLPLSYQALP